MIIRLYIFKYVYIYYIYIYMYIYIYIHANSIILHAFSYIFMFVFIKQKSPPHRLRRLWPQTVHHPRIRRQGDQIRSMESCHLLNW